MEPRDQLFATLDVTVHAGKLPCNLTVLFIDTIGFISDIPKSLLSAFSATLEDAVLAVSALLVTGRLSRSYLYLHMFMWDRYEFSDVANRISTKFCMTI